MKKVVLKLNVSPKKFEATQQFMQEKGLDIESELSDSVAKLYKKYVPADVRKSIERAASATRSTSSNLPPAAPEEPSKPGVFEENSSGNFRDFGLLCSNEV